MTELTIRLATLLLSLESAVASALDAVLGVAICDAAGCDDEAEPAPARDVLDVARPPGGDDQLRVCYRWDISLEHLSPDRSEGMDHCPEDLIGAAKLYEAAILKRGATNTRAEWDAASVALEEAKLALQSAILDFPAVFWLAHIDD